MQPERTKWALDRARTLLRQAAAGVEHEGGDAGELREILIELDALSINFYSSQAPRRKRSFLGQ